MLSLLETFSELLLCGTNDELHSLYSSTNIVRVICEGGQCLSWAVEPRKEEEEEEEEEEKIKLRGMT
jgi:hypothetical protein